MTNAIEAKFFDGQSSLTQQVTVVFYERINEFRFQSLDGTSFVWKLDDLQFEQYGNLLEIRNKKYSGAILKIDDKDFSENLYTIRKQKNSVDIHTRLLKLGFSKIALIAIALLGLIVFSYFYLLPPIAEKSVVLLPDSFDDSLGDIFMETFIDPDDVDVAKTNYLEQFAAELNLENRKPLHFSVVKSEEVNAFALPNGQIVVYTGILEKMNNYDELVALLGHEASHVNCRHSMKMLSRNLAGYMVVSLIFSDVNGIMAVFTENARQLHSLSYSRKFEQEADEKGLKILIDNNVNPNGMVKLFERLEEEDNASIPEIISSHPLTIERKKDMREIISRTNYEVKPNEKLEFLFEKMK